MFLGSATLNDDDVQDLLGGLWYINIHSEFAPGGELRGQIFQAVAAPIPTPTPVPEPATLALLALGLAGLGFARRRRG